MAYRLQGFSNVPSEFVSLVKVRKKELKLSWRSLAARADMHPSTLCRLVQFERNLPSDDVILELARALEIVPRELLLIEALRLPKDAGLNAMCRYYLLAMHK